MVTNGFVWFSCSILNGQNRPFYYNCCPNIQSLNIQLYHNHQSVAKCFTQMIHDLDECEMDEYRENFVKNLLWSKH